MRPCEYPFGSPFDTLFTCLFIDIPCLASFVVTLKLSRTTFPCSHGTGVSLEKGASLNAARVAQCPSELGSPTMAGYLGGYGCRM